MSPDFLVIGAARSGTTALYNYLNQHPDIFMPKTKEPNFFAYEDCQLNVKGPGADFINNSVTDMSRYKALFSEAGGRITGEASPLYLYEPRAPKRIFHHAPRVKMVAILRNPVEQAYSHFMYATRLLVEDEPDFVNALHREEERLEKGWQPLFGYSSFPRYGEQLQRYFDLFAKEQFFISTYEEFEDSPQQTISAIFEHIGVDADFTPDISYRPNAGGVPKSQLFQDFLIKPNAITGLIAKVIPLETRSKIRDHLVARNLSKKDEGMPKEAREILVSRLEDDVTKLSKLLGRDFSHWLES